jgi:TPR repeat protein
MDAAKLGDAAAENNVGQLYEVGRGVPANGAEAFAWYKRAAEAGLGRAQVNLARCYIEGRGTAPDRAAATLWLDRAQKQGMPEAAKLLDWLTAN